MLTEKLNKKFLKTICVRKKIENTTLLALSLLVSCSATAADLICPHPKDINYDSGHGETVMKATNRLEGDSDKLVHWYGSAPDSYVDARDLTLDHFFVTPTNGRFGQNVYCYYRLENGDTADISINTTRDISNYQGEVFYSDKGTVTDIPCVNADVCKIHGVD
jgi:hypothetical protein